MFDIVFLVNSILLGVGLAMDAFCVSVANGLKEPKMKVARMCFIASIYAIFQFAMPMIGWICIHTIVVYFNSFRKFIPWIALILLLYIGGKMIFEGIKGKEQDVEHQKTLSFSILLVQGIATSIDALSVGFTIAEYEWFMALIASIIIAVETFIICIIGLKIGKVVGKKIEEKASILGGIILIGIGIEIFVKGFFE